MYIQNPIHELKWVKFQVRNWLINEFGYWEWEVHWYYKNKNKAWSIKPILEIGDTCKFYYEDWTIKWEVSLISIDSKLDEKRWYWKLYYLNWDLQLEFESIWWPVCYQEWYFCDDLWRFECLYFWKVNVEARDSSYIAREWWDDCWFDDEDYDDDAEYIWRYDEYNWFYIRDTFYTWLYDWKYVEYYKWWSIKCEANYEKWKLEWERIVYDENWNKKVVEMYHNCVLDWNFVSDDR